MADTRETLWKRGTRGRERERGRREGRWVARKRGSEGQMEKRGNGGVYRNIEIGRGG